MKSNTYVLIMAGGLGSRFWPKSRENFPKQFIDILGTGESLLQQTVARFKGICEMDNMLVLTNENYKDLVQEQLPGILPQNILLEPTRNNTAPCIAYACYKILAVNPNANIVVSPSDQLILKENEFKLRIEQGLNYTAQNDALLTLGIHPTRPDTGYGYIHFQNDITGICKVNQFLEKPVFEKAKAYVESGNYLWNAGIFIWNVKSIISALESLAADVAQIFRAGMPFYGTSEEVKFIHENYPNSPNISIDYAILEKANNVYTIPSSIGWSDLGTWASLYENMPKDELNNAVNISTSLLMETENCMIHLHKNKAILIKGLKDFIVVDDGKVLVIVPKSDEQEIKGWSKQIIENFGKEYC